jgi:hypothetical protein
MPKTHQIRPKARFKPAHLKKKEEFPSQGGVHRPAFLRGRRGKLPKPQFRAIRPNRKSPGTRRPKNIRANLRTDPKTRAQLVQQVHGPPKVHQNPQRPSFPQKIFPHLRLNPKNPKHQKRRLLHLRNRPNRPTNLKNPFQKNCRGEKSTTNLASPRSVDSCPKISIQPNSL